jgi:hypothetical protein
MRAASRLARRASCLSAFRPNSIVQTKSTFHFFKCQCRFASLDTLHRCIRRSDVVKVFEMLLDHFENIGIRRRAGLGGVLGDQPMNFIRHFNGDALVHRTILNRPIYNSSPVASPPFALAAPRPIR